MFDPQKMVRQFHREMGHPAPEEPTLEKFRAKLRADLILEEAIEFVNAAGYAIGWRVKNPDGSAVEELDLSLVRVADPDWPEMIDALCDLAYVTFGAAVEMGIDLEPFFKEVHRANVEKRGGETRADGKSLKPEGWKPPQIARMLVKKLGAVKEKKKLEAVKAKETNG